MNKETGGPAVDRAWIIERLRERGWSMRRLGREIGWDIATISRALAGKRPFRVAEVPPLARALGVSVPDLLPHLGLAGRAHGLPTLWRLDAEGDLRDAEGETASVTDLPLPAGAVGIRAHTAGGTYDCLDGWLLVVDRRASGIDPLAIGWLALVEPKDGAPMLVKVVRMTGASSVLARGIGQTVDTVIEGATVSPVIAMLP